LKIGRILDGEEARMVIVEGDDVYEAVGLSLFDSLEKGPHIANVAACRFLPPTDPSKVIAIGLNYVAHAKESGSELPKYPLIFLKPPSSVIGHLDPIMWPSMTEQIGYESELGVVIGKRCKNVPKERALDYVLGYACANDVSARDCQRNDGQWSRAKGFDTFCPYGPWIETELDPGNVAISGKLNGEVRQNSNTSDLVFDVPHLIWHVSQVYTLMPGDLLITGTPAGVGLMKEGDAYEVILDGVGSLKNQLMRRG